MPLPVEFIARKRDGLSHTDDEIRQWICDYTEDRIPDYQMSAWAMAVYLKGMTPTETAALTHSMLITGDVLDWEGRAERPVVDKHSTGGVGDKVSLILAPLLAACGLRVPMISGRGLGPTGGTLDKLESISGFQTQLTTTTIQRIVDEVGCVIGGAGEKIAPADKRLYALRDVTATVASIPLITASIMSKKLAEGLDALVLDVKHGSGAFMKSLDDAQRLARSLVQTGAAMGVATTALLTDMNQPLGRWIGNAVEVNEALQCLQGEGPDDVMEVTLALGAKLLESAGAFEENQQEDAIARLQSIIASGHGREAFEQMVRMQGGDLHAARPLARQRDVLAPVSGYVTSIDTERIGYAMIDLGGGRRRKSDTIDFGVGMEILARIGNRIERGQPLATILARSEDDHARASASLLNAVKLSDAHTPAPPLIRRSSDEY